MDKNKIPVNLEFKRDGLLKDIKRVAYVKGDTSPVEDGHQVHQLIDICEDGNIDRVGRVMQIAVGECREMLYPYSRKDIAGPMDLNDAQTGDISFRIDLMVPESFSETTVRFLVSIIHDYIVYRVLLEWVGISHVQDRDTIREWTDKLETLKDKLHTAIITGNRRARRRMSPF